jgi:hypothetical protein
MDKKIGLVMIFVGISIAISGYYVTTFWMYNIGRGDYNVKGETVLKLSWYLEKGDRTEGGFTVSGGNKEVKFYITDPSGVIIHDAGIVKSSYSNGFTTQDSGMYSFYFENLEPLSDKYVHAGFRSPYEPRLTTFDIAGLLIMLGGITILAYGACVCSFIRFQNIRVHQT